MLYIYQLEYVFGCEDDSHVCVPLINNKFVWFEMLIESCV